MQCRQQSKTKNTGLVDLIDHVAVAHPADQQLGNSEKFRPSGMYRIDDRQLAVVSQFEFSGRSRFLSWQGLSLNL